MDKLIEDFFSRHERVVLQFSAGKDSAACLWLLQPYWDRLTVLWANGGNPYPETIEYMDYIWGLVPHFVELVGEQPGWVIKHGWPVDVLPISASSFSSQMHDRQVPKLQPFNQCCSHNIWEPMAKYFYEYGITGIIRGQKSCDLLKPSFRSGDKFQNMEFFHPIEDWSTEQVMSYLGDKLPASYKRGLPSSLDCMNCTAYAKENSGRVKDLELIYPPAAAQISSIHSFLRDELKSQLSDLESLHG